MGNARKISKMYLGIGIYKVQQELQAICHDCNTTVPSIKGNIQALTLLLIFHAEME